MMGMVMRFTCYTEDGEYFIVKDGNTEFARVHASELAQVINDWMRGDKWREATFQMLCSWNATVQHHRTKHSGDRWDQWIGNVLRSFNERARSMLKEINKGNCGIHKELYLQSRAFSKSNNEWLAKLRFMSERWNRELNRNVWSEWCHNVTRSQAQRMRRKDDRQKAKGDT